MAQMSIPRTGTEGEPSAGPRELQVALWWGDSMVELQRYREPVDLHAGSAAGSGLQVFDEVLGASFPLAHFNRSSLQVCLPKEAVVEVMRPGGVRADRAQLQSEGRLDAATGRAGAELLEVAPTEAVKISLAHLTLLLAQRRGVGPVALGHRRGGGGLFAWTAAACVALAAVFIWALLSMASTERERVAVDYRPPPPRYLKMLIRAERPPLPPKLKGLTSKAKGAERVAKEDEGTRSVERTARPEARQALRAPGALLPPREVDRRKVLSTGVLGALSEVKGSGASVLRQEGLGAGIERAVSGIRGSAQGAGTGSSPGVGTRGGGTPGGGGAGAGLGGVGDFGLRGQAPGEGGAGPTALGGRGKESVRIIPGKTVIEGALSKEVIAQVIARHQSEIRYCYEQELQKSPDLAGKVSVLFVIDAKGLVAEANVAESSLGSPPAESCILARIRRWKFPEPAGGGVVSVTFPWIFRSAGEASGTE